MELTVTIDNDSISIPMPNPFKVDLQTVEGKIKDFIKSKDIEYDKIDINGLISRMIRGVAGCEKGCPANALDLVQRGFKGFKLSYVDGGILTASLEDSGKTIYFRMFPDF